jgi:pre-mRNA-splicing helicase BRR2
MDVVIKPSHVIAVSSLQCQDILRGAADEVLSILKDDTLTDPKRHVEVEKLIRKVTPERFNKMVTLGKQIHDFRTGGGEEGEEVDEEQQLDEEMGVAVVFDEDDEEEEESDIDEVQEDEDEVSALGLCGACRRMWVFVFGGVYVCRRMCVFFGLWLTVSWLDVCVCVGR